MDVRPSAARYAPVQTIGRNDLVSSIVSEILDLLPGDPMDLIGKALGIDGAGADSAAQAAVPTLLAGLNTRMAAQDGPGVVQNLVKDADPGLLGNLAGFLKGGDFSKGAAAIGSIFGARQDEVTDGLEKHLSLGKGVGGKLLGMLAPIVLSFLAKKGLPGGGLAGLLRGAIPAILGGSAGGLLGKLGFTGGHAVPTAAAASGTAETVRETVRHEAETVAHERKRAGIWPLLTALALGLGLLIFGINACKDDPKPVAANTETTTDAPAAAGTIVDVATSAGSYGSLLGLLDSSGLSADLQGAGPFTVLAPSDDAFGAIDAADLDALKADPAKLKEVLLSHVVPGTLKAADFTDGQQLKTLAGTVINVGVADGTVSFNGVDVATPDIAASNGVIHGLSGVILDAKKLSTGAGLAAGVAGDYGPWRVQAWRDKVFGNLKAATAARAEKLDDFQGGYGIRINP